MDTRHLQLTTARGDVVSALATTPDTADAAYVFAHGAGAGMEHRFMQAVAEGLAARRVACLRYQFPSMQAGKRRVDSPAVAHDTVRAAVGLAQQLWAAMPLFAGGKSFGGRMTSQAQAIAPLPGVRGLAFLGFPLHPAGKPSVARAEHLADVDIPMLFVRGTRDALAEAAPFDEASAPLARRATRVDIAEADHGFSVLRRSGRTDDEALDEALDALVVWTQAWHIHPAG
ncbi:alpha/beta family hydrolase [Pseudorhodoferax sp. Leaf267]|uniref:alpha/beta hydrolase family protein n=1 Tax=Pseudorhodoferax sp. Leaf267 TaxID=1736316 RepID=UPI0006FA4A2D|nr:alpha/beta family hydrolase [Pseudorhodoferax sp. Leaf267]KQP15800.1 alpha/beta hydrolase [Pseudorhodoferax sp. Leaf267]